MRFQVPQFIETESKLIGPLTLYQFIWVALGAGILMILFRLIPFIIFILVAIPIAILFGGLAFYKIDGMPTLQYIMYAVQYLMGQKKYVYEKKEERSFYEEG